MGNLFKWGKYESFYLFSYKITSIFGGFMHTGRILEELSDAKIFVQTHSGTFVPLFVMFHTTLQPHYDNNL